ncbi:MAG: fibronectin type III domain-containing protein [Desulfobacterales bacterium]|nr:fibronectin type III domain-containing protein [Desulfobacterales bacterium]
MSPSHILTRFLRTGFSAFSPFGFISLVVFALIVFLSAQNAHPAGVILAWDPNSEPDLAGYRIFCRQEGESYNYGAPAWEGTEPSCAVYDLDYETTYYFVAKAYDTSGNESGDSNEVRYELPVSNADFGGFGTAGTDEIETDEDYADVGCFIASAAFGSYVEPHMKVLRDLRDEYLLANRPGRRFVGMYYRYSPFWARVINIHRWGKPVVRLALMPLVCTSYVLVGASFIIKVLAGLLLAAFVLGCFVRPSISESHNLNDRCR